MGNRGRRSLRRQALRHAGVLVAVLACLSCARPPTASASITGAACTAVGDANRVAGGACDILKSPGKLLSVGKNLLNGRFGDALKSIFGGGGSSSASTASTALGLAAIVTWVVTGAKFALSETGKVLGQTTSPQLRTTWFSSTYWRIAAIAALLTVPFLFAAAVQALIRSELALLTHAALGYLPLAMLAVAIAAPLTMLLLAATDQLCAVVSSAGGGSGLHPDLAHALFSGVVLGAVSLRAPFLLFLVGLVTTGGAIVLWLELAIREAAVYVAVLMLPLAFAAMVWPARRVWAVRAVELLVALILSKLAIVAVLDLGGAAIDQLGHHGLGALAAGLAGTGLVLLAAFSPWAVLRLVPLSELASGAAGSLRPAAAGTWREARALGPTPPSALSQGDGELAPPAARQANGADTSADPRRGAESALRRLADQSEPNAATSRTASGSATDERRSDLAPVFAASADGSSEPGGHADAEGRSGGRPDAGGPEDWILGWSPFVASKDAGPLTLGSDAEWLRPRDGHQPGEGDESRGGGGSPRREPATADDPDPLPPRQDSYKGQL